MAKTQMVIEQAESGHHVTRGEFTSHVKRIDGQFDELRNEVRGDIQRVEDRLSIQIGALGAKMDGTRPDARILLSTIGVVLTMGAMGAALVWFSITSAVGPVTQTQATMLTMMRDAQQSRENNRAEIVENQRALDRREWVYETMSDILRQRLRTSIELDRDDPRILSMRALEMSRVALERGKQ